MIHREMATETMVRAFTRTQSWPNSLVVMARTCDPRLPHLAHTENPKSIRDREEFALYDEAYMIAALVRLLFLSLWFSWCDAGFQIISEHPALGYELL